METLYFEYTENVDYKPLDGEAVSTTSIHIVGATEYRFRADGVHVVTDAGEVKVPHGFFSFKAMPFVNNRR